MTTDIPRIKAVWAEAGYRNPEDARDLRLVMGRSATNDMPWPSNAADMAHFANETRDHVMIMGRNTYDSLPPHVKYSATGTAARPLVVLTHDPIWAFQQTVEAKRNGVTAYFGGLGLDGWPETLLAFVRSHFPEKSIAVIGGPSVIELFTNFYDRLVISFIAGLYDGDVFAPYQDVPSKLAHITDFAMPTQRELPVNPGEPRVTVYTYQLKGNS